MVRLTRFLHWLLSFSKLGSHIYLNATFRAAAFDEHYHMALVYCFDKNRRYCFSLSRFPEDSTIEVMVLDQINCKVDDLSVELHGNVLTAHLTQSTAARLDGHTEYVVELEGSDQARKALIDALVKIFEGKSGLYIDAEVA